MIEVQISLVRCGKDGQLLYKKGKVAEELNPCPRRRFWGIAEYVIHCHKNMWSAIVIV